MSTATTFREGQQVALALAPVFSGTLSVIGSSFIACIILSDRHEKLKKTYHRLLLGLSVSDVSSSLCYILNAFFSPSGTPGVWQAHGNQRTCTALGFFAQLGFASTLYTSSLALYYYLRIRAKTSGSSGKTFRCIEPLMHMISIGYPVLTAFAGVFLELYNPLQLGVGCWISAYPWGCLEDDNIQCTRGEHADFYVYPFGGILVILGYLIVVSCMLAIYCAIRKQIIVMRARYGLDERQALSDGATHRLRETGHQAILYCAAFILATVWTGVARILENNTNNAAQFAIAILSQIFYPLQGFFNVFIFIRPRYITVRRNSPYATRWEVLLRIIYRMDVDGSAVPGRRRQGYGSETRANSRSGDSRLMTASDASGLAISERCPSESRLMTAQDLQVSNPYCASNLDGKVDSEKTCIARENIQNSPSTTAAPAVVTPNAAANISAMSAGGETDLSDELHTQQERAGEIPDSSRVEVTAIEQLSQMKCSNPRKLMT